MNMDNVRTIKTNFFSKIAYDVIDSVFGQLSDGWGENNPSNDKWWKFACAAIEPNGQVVVKVSNEYCKNEYFGHGQSHTTYNAWQSFSDSQVLEKIAKFIKKTMKMELDDDGVKNGWKRSNVNTTTCYLNRDTDINVAQVYCIYESLLGRPMSSKYTDDVMKSVFGVKKSDEEVAAAIALREAKDKLFKERDDALALIEAEKKARLAEIEKKYNEDCSAIVAKCYEGLKRIEAA